MIDGSQFSQGNINWPEVIIKLNAYADWLIKHYSQTIKMRPESFLKGKQEEDYVYETIEQFLRNPEKFNPNKRSLVGYLKMHILRHLIHNDVSSSESTLKFDVFAKKFSTDEQRDNYLDSILPFTNDFTDENLDADTILQSIEEQIKGDKCAENLFLGVVCYGMKRREVCAEFQLTEKEYDNGIRRLGTVYQKIIKKFEIIKPKST